MAWFEYAGHRIYYEESGSGDPVLLLPGWAGTISEFDQIGRALARQFKVIAADLPGCGKSEPQPRRYTPAYFRDDAALLIEMVRALATAPIRIAGFSDGGEYALLIAALEPSAVRSIVTWGSAGQLPNAPEMADAFGSVIDSPPPPLQAFSEYMKSTYGADNARAMAQSWAKALRAMMEAGGDISRSRASEIACPALLIAGESDSIAPPALVSEMAAAIRRGEFQRVEGAGHAIHRERAEWLTKTLADWLAGH